MGVLTKPFSRYLIELGIHKKVVTLPSALSVYAHKKALFLTP